MIVWTRINSTFITYNPLLFVVSAVKSENGWKVNQLCAKPESTKVAKTLHYKGLLFV